MNAPTRDLKAKVWERDALDWYVEDGKVSDALFRVERFVGYVWDPACGGGNILEAASRADYPPVGTDIKKRVNRYWFRREADFLAWNEQPLAQNILCNPPYGGGKLAEAFIRQALALATGKVAMFLDTRFLSGAKRAAGLYAEHRPHRAWILTPRPSCPPGEWLAAGNTAGGGTADFLWLVWDKTAPPAVVTDLRWLNWGNGK